MESLANNVTNTGDMQWEYRQVSVTRVPGYGFGIAVSGGRDNPHFSSGDPSIAVSDVLAHGPAERLLQVNDRILSVNGVSLLNVDYATAVQVLRDSGDTVVLSVKRRAPPPSPGAPTRITLTRAGKKDDFGIVIGCKLFVKEISSKARDQLALSNQHLQEGDIVTRLHNTSCGDTMSLKEARKIMDSCKERLSLVVTRPQPNTPPGKFDTNGDRNVLDEVAGPPLGYSQQNLYVQPPTRHQRGPSNQSHHENHSGIEPPRPPPPRVDALMNPGRSPYDEDPLVTRRGVGVAHHPRLIAFQKEGSVGIRLTGGNRAGIFVTAVQPGSPASLQGLQPGDKILKVNDMDMAGVTREEAVLFLLGLQDRIELTVQLCKDEYDGAVAAQQGDSFYIKAHFHYETPAKGEMSFRAGDVFHVVDTLYNGVVGCWQVFRVGRNNQEVQKGIIPNKARAEELATAQFNASKKDGASGESRGSFFRRRRPQHRRSKSLGKEHWDDILFSDGTSKFPAYERVVLRHPGFVRPIVLFGAIADIARDKLLRDFPDQFVSPQSDNETNSSSKGGAPHIIRLSAIRDVMATGKHALLDVTPAAVERLNYAQLYPIAVLLRADSKLVVKQLRQGLPKTAHRSSKKLLEQSARLERSWGHLLSATIPLSDASDHWYRKLREILDRHQAAALWTAETKPEEGLSDDFLFPMSSLRLSYASSPESDLEHSPGRGARLHRASSDPSVATAEPPTTPSAVPPPPYRPAAPASPNHGSPHGPADGKYGFSSLQPPPSHHHHQQDLDQESPILNGNGHHHGMSAIYGVGHERQRSGLYVHAPAPDLPPRIDRAVKPSGSTGLLAPAPARQSRSAHERLFPAKPPPNQSSPHDMNNDQSNYHHLGNFINNSSRNGSSLERRQDTSKLISYDSMSSYDSYSNHPQQRNSNSNNNNANTHGHHHASPKRYLGPNAHDDLKRHLVVETRTDYGRYKPVPPPKPKHYRPPLQGDDGAGYYYNVPEPRGAADGAHLPPRPHPPPTHVPRASAFELYRKPTTQYR